MAEYTYIYKRRKEGKYKKSLRVKDDICNNKVCTVPGKSQAGVKLTSGSYAMTSCVNLYNLVRIFPQRLDNLVTIISNCLLLHSFIYSALTPSYKQRNSWPDFDNLVVYISVLNSGVITPFVPKNK